MDKDVDDEQHEADSIAEELHLPTRLATNQVRSVTKHVPQPRILPLSPARGRSEVAAAEAAGAVPGRAGRPGPPRPRC